jgi:hypothetical protein
MYMPGFNAEAMLDGLDFPQGYIPEVVPCFAFNHFVKIYIDKIIQAMMKLRYEVCSSSVLQFAIEIKPLVIDYLSLVIQESYSNHSNLLNEFKQKGWNSHELTPLMLCIKDPHAPFFIGLLQYDEAYLSQLLKVLRPQLQIQISSLPVISDA